MTFQQANRPGGPGPTTQDAPSQVRAAARSRELGDLVGTRHGTSTRHTLLLGGGIAAGCLVVDLALWHVVSTEDPFSAAYSFMHAVYRAMAIGVIVGLAIAIRALVIGQQSYYLYTGGLVHTRRSTFRSIAWSDVVRLATIHDRRSTGGDVGKVLGYRLELADGGKVSIPLDAAARQGGRDAFIDRLLDAARERNLPIA